MKQAALPTDIAPRANERAPAGVRPWALWLAVAGIALLALLLRVWTIRQSLPFVDHPDEPNPIDYVVGMLRTGDPNQRFFQKPSLFVYLLLAALQVHYRLGQAAGLYGDIATMVVTTHTVTTLPGFFMVARWVSATMGALTALAAYGLGVRGWGRGAGLVGALLVAVLPYHLRFSQWATTDVTAALLATLSLSAAVLALRTNRWSAYLVAGACAGLAASAKYNAGAVVAAIVAAAVLNLWPARGQTTDERTTDAERLTRNAGRAAGARAAASRNGSAFGVRRSALVAAAGRLALAGVAALACFVAGTPYALLSPELVGGGIARQWTNYGGANGHYRGAWNLAGYASFFWGESLGPVGCLLTLIGLAILAARRWPVLVVWLGFALTTLLVHLSRPTHFMQNMLPLLVACALPAGVAVVELPHLVLRQAAGVRRLALKREGGSFWSDLLPRSRGFPLSRPGGAGAERRTKSGRGGARFAVGAAGFRSALQGLLLALLIGPLALGAAQHVLRQAAGDSRLELLGWLEAHVPPGARIAAELKAIPGSTEVRWTDVPALPAHDLAWYRSQGYAYLVASSNRWGQFTLPERYAALAGAGPIASFGPVRREDMLGPRLEVFATGLAAADVPAPLAGAVQVGGARLLGVAIGDPVADGEPPMLVPTRQFRAGGVLGLRSFWQVAAPFDRDLLIFVHLLDAAGGRPTQRDAAPWQGRYPTTSWRPGSLVVDANDVYLPPGMAPGEYRVLIGMYHQPTGERPPVTIDGQPVPAGTVDLGTIQVTSDQ